MSAKRYLAVGLGLLMFAFAGSTLRADEAKSAKVDDEGFVRNWLILGPISVDGKVQDHTEDACKEFLDREYFSGQKDAKPKAGDKASVGGNDMTWKPVDSDDAILDTNKVASDQGKETDNSVYLGLAYIVAPNDLADVRLAIGSDDDSLWRVNGKEVIRVYAARAAEQDTDRSEPLTLKKGANIVSFTLINGDGPSGVCARFLDKDDKPVTGLTVDREPGK
jgi:hypothetical protein